LVNGAEPYGRFDAIAFAEEVPVSDTSVWLLDIPADSSNGFPSGGSGVGVTLAAAASCSRLFTSSASARTFISFMRPDFVKEKILLYNLLILRITGILKIMPVIDNPYGSR